MGVEKGLDCTNAYRSLVARTEARTSQAAVELAESEPAAALELGAVLIHCRNKSKNARWTIPMLEFTSVTWKCY